MAIENIHAPYYYESRNSNTIVIFIHGIMGSPGQFKILMAAAGSSGYSVSSMLLPGHGGTVRDFAKSNRSQWCAAVKEHIEVMGRRYSNIILVGHSMGSLLAFSSYNFYPDKIKGIIAIATPLRIAIKPRAIRASYAVAMGKTGNNDHMINAAYNACSVKRLSIWDYIYSVPRFIDLFLLMRSTRKELSRVKAPSLIIHSQNDEIVSIKSAACLEKNLCTYKTLKLKKSGHYYYPDEDQRTLTDMFIQFLGSI